MSVFVLEASVTLAVLLEDESSPYADAVVELLKRDEAVASRVWPLEVANAILTAVRRGRILAADAPLLVGALNGLRVEVDRETADAWLALAVVNLGIAYGLTAYDASYLELALRRDPPFATIDRRLRDAASAAGILILQP